MYVYGDLYSLNNCNKWCKLKIAKFSFLSVSSEDKNDFFDTSILYANYII